MRSPWGLGGVSSAAARSSAAERRGGAMEGTPLGPHGPAEGAEPEGGDALLQHSVATQEVASACCQRGIT